MKQHKLLLTCVWKIGSIPNEGFPNWHMRGTTYLTFKFRKVYRQSLEQVSQQFLLHTKNFLLIWNLRNTIKYLYFYVLNLRSDFLTYSFSICILDREACLRLYQKSINVFLQMYFLANIAVPNVNMIFVQ